MLFIVSFCLVFSQNAYVFNDSSSSHKLSQKYDDERDSVRFYVDGAEKKAVQMVPDWANTQLVKSWRGNWPSPGKYTIFTAPSDGYVTIYDCYNTSDYYLNVNGKICAYHKCMYTNSSNGFFMIAKGDYIVLQMQNDSTIKTNYSSTAITFIPGKITED